MSISILSPTGHAPPVRAMQGAVPLAERAVAWWAVLGGTCAVLLVPLFLVDVPPLLDYPNHLARMYVLAAGAHDPFLSRMYQQDWAVIPNLAIDLVLPALIHVLPIYVAGRIMLVATLLLPLAGAIAYHRAVFRVRSYWPFATALIAYNALFILGFMNFLIGLGLALLAAAAWVRWRDSRPVAVALGGAAAATALFFVHIFGVGFLALVIGGRELAWLLRNRPDRAGIWTRAWQDAAIGLTAFLPAVVLYLMAPLGQTPAGMMWLPWVHKLLWLAEPFLTYDGPVDWVVAVAFLTLVYVLARIGRLRAAPGLPITLGVLFAIYLACPFVMKQTGFIDARFPVMIGLLGIAGIRPVRLAPRPRLLLAAVLAVTFLARTASLAAVWYGHNQDVADMRQVIASVPPGARVLVVAVDPQDAPEYWTNLPRGREIPYYFRIEFHLPALLLLEHRAFWPCMFTEHLQQPVSLRPPYDRIGYPGCQPPDWQSLVVGYSVHPVTPAPYLADWRRNFDDVLLLNAGGAGDLSQYLPGVLHLIAARDVAALYRIVRP